MPTYEYRCPNCGNDFELFQKMSEEPVAACPKCDTPSQRRLSGELFGGKFEMSGGEGDQREDAAKRVAGAAVDEADQIAGEKQS